MGRAQGNLRVEQACRRINGCFGSVAVYRRPAAVGQKPPYVTAFENDKAGAYVMYCTNAVSTRRALPYLAVVCIPDRLTVRSA